MTLALPAPTPTLHARPRGAVARHAMITRMSEPPSAFDASLAVVVAAHRGRAAEPSTYERAWREFWCDHYQAFLQQAVAYAARGGLANHLHSVEEELMARTLKRIASGKQVNRKVLFGIRRNVIGEVRAQVARLERQDVFERLVERMRAGGIDEATHRQLRGRLDEVIAEVELGQRARLKGDILRSILEEDVYKQNGAISFAQVARLLERPEGTVRRAWRELRMDMEARYPDLADFLDSHDEVLDAELVETIRKDAP
jgi:hypothetical protein